MTIQCTDFLLSQFLAMAVPSLKTGDKRHAYLCSTNVVRTAWDKTGRQLIRGLTRIWIVSPGECWVRQDHYVALFIAWVFVLRGNMLQWAPRRAYHTPLNGEKHHSGFSSVT